MVEHQSRKLGVVGSNPTGGNILSLEKLEKLSSQLAGFEPTRAEPIGFQVQRLNHSAILPKSAHEERIFANDGVRTRAAVPSQKFLRLPP